jgi:hypothetical protein
MAVTDDILLLDARTTNGDGTAVSVYFPNGRSRVYAYGVPDGSTSTLKCSPDNGTTYITMNDIHGDPVAFTANGVTEIETAVGEPLIATVSSAGAGTSMSMKLRQL